jgi:hypothetical protein
MQAHFGRNLIQITPGKKDFFPSHEPYSFLKILEKLIK